MSLDSFSNPSSSGTECWSGDECRFEVRTEIEGKNIAIPPLRKATPGSYVPSVANAQGKEAKRRLGRLLEEMSDSFKRHKANLGRYILFKMGIKKIFTPIHTFKERRSNKKDTKQVRKNQPRPFLLLTIGMIKCLHSQ